MKTRIGFVSNSSSSSFIYHCVSECKDLNEFKEKFVEALEKELNSKKWQKRLSPRSIAEKIASETVSYAEDVIEDDRYQK